MKKILFFVMAICATAFVSCTGNASKSEEVKDTVTVDSLVPDTLVPDTTVNENDTVVLEEAVAEEAAEL